MNIDKANQYVNINPIFVPDIIDISDRMDDVDNLDKPMREEVEE